MIRYNHRINLRLRSRNIMLTKCPECELQISDKAFTCPHCGYPLKTSNNRARRKPNRRRRLPNGFGQISELKKQNLRKPFRAMVTIGKTDEGKPICKLLQPEAYFGTYNEAYEALLNYNKNPYNISPNITMAELFERWIKEYEQNVESTEVTNLCWRYCHDIYNIPVKDIRIQHIKHCMDEGTVEVAGKIRKPSGPMKAKMKSMFNKMLDHAVQYEIVEKNYARTFNLTKAEKRQADEVADPHFPFTHEEVQKLWKNITELPFVDMMLIQCYTGMRPKELIILETKNINLEERIMTGGVKTEAGKNRVIPIHSKIFSLIEKWYNDASSNNRKYLFEVDGEPFDNWKYKRRFDRIVAELGLNKDHRPHDARLYFVTTAKEYGVDEYAIKYIVGHKINDITEKVYTKRTIDWLKTEIEKIK